MRCTNAEAPLAHQQPSPEHTRWPLNLSGPPHRSLLDELLGIPQNPVHTSPILGILGKRILPTHRPPLALPTSTPEGRPGATPHPRTPRPGGPEGLCSGSQHGSSHSCGPCRATHLPGLLRHGAGAQRRLLRTDGLRLNLEEQEDPTVCVCCQAGEIHSAPGGKGPACSAGHGAATSSTQD